MLTLQLSLSVLLSGLIFFANHGSAEQSNENYYGFRVYRARPTSRDAAESFQQRAVAELDGTSVLKIAREINDTMDLLVAPHNVKELLFLAKQLEVPLALIDEDFERTLNGSELNTRRNERSFSLFRYNSHQEIDRYLQELANRNPKVMTYEFRGRSYEGREIKLVRLSSDPNRRKPAIFIDAGIHAREWFAPVTAIQLVHALVEDPRFQDLLKDLDWYVLPLVNPDGYEFSRSSKKNRLWRKTRSRTPVAGCFGVDGNRNFGYQFAVSGATTTDPCHTDIYAGPRAFSEPETRIVKDIITNTKDLKLYISLHAYGQYLVYPWGYTDAILPPTWRKLNKLAKKVSNSVARSGGKPFKVMSAGQWYPAAGGSDDYAFAIGRVPYAFTMELTDEHGFLFPENDLQEAVPPFMAGFKTFGEEILVEFRNEY